MGLFLIAYSGIEQPIFSLHRPLAKPGVSKILITGTSLTVIMYKKGPYDLSKFHSVSFSLLPYFISLHSTTIELPPVTSLLTDSVHRQARTQTTSPYRTDKFHYSLSLYPSFDPGKVVRLCVSLYFIL